MKPITLDDYKDKYECMSFEREDGILVARIHRANDPKRPVVWGAVEHEEMSHCSGNFNYPWFPYSDAEDGDRDLRLIAN